MHNVNRTKIAPINEKRTDQLPPLFAEGLAHTIDWFKQNWDKIEASTSFGPGMSSAVRGYK